MYSMIEWLNAIFVVLQIFQIQHFLQFVKTIYKDLPTNVVWFIYKQFTVEMLKSNL